MRNPVGWFEIYVNDMNRAKKFYQSVLQTEFRKLAPGPELEMWAFPMDMSVYGAGGALVKMPGFPAAGNSTIIYFSCDDCGVEEKRIVPEGGKVQKPKFSIGEFGFISLGIDTEGNIFGLHSQK
jgi:predicted enzyme related to lactoylglutathione lyase